MHLHALHGPLLSIHTPFYALYQLLGAGLFLTKVGCAPVNAVNAESPMSSNIEI